MARSDRTAEVRDLPRRAGCRRVLHRPAADADGGAGRVEDLDEVVLERRAGVAAATVDLAEDEVRGRRAIDGVDLTGEVAVAGARSAERIAGAVDDRVVVGEIESERAVAGAGAGGHGVAGAAAGDVRDCGAAEASGGEREVGAVHAGD